MHLILLEFLLFIKMIGGEDIESDREFPFMAKVRDLKFKSSKNDYIACAGIVISNEKILIPLTCSLNVDKVFTSKRFEVEVGTRSSRECDDLCQRRVVKKIYYHPKYEENPNIFNLAIIVIKQIQFHTFLQPANISTVEEIKDLKPGNDCLISGWVYRYEPESHNTLQAAKVRIAATHMCENISGFENEYMLCVHTDNLDVASDALGGPLVCKGHVVGISAWGKFENEGSFFVYYKISAHMDWILSPTHIVVIRVMYLVTIFVLLFMYITCASSCFYFFVATEYNPRDQLPAILGTI